MNEAGEGCGFLSENILSSDGTYALSGANREIETPSQLGYPPSPLDLWNHQVSAKFPAKYVF
jgi:hypothetical protein